ncbi:hypothetical protein DQ04_00631130 [Trypanosoma grayi]|uniref:hypothetical protein n=1 Tax=Trypanosoma grayi TaxID=71804 RepID=UPI0004F3F2B8|nr:hypothetical protein DQ04_00631130 [Trypanosoma grayi]KEG14089.1 hypothetical protein DQ04_00631130 [Trypanosoma grayi]
MTDIVPISLQCYMGRFELPVDRRLTVRESLRHFQRSVPALGQVEMGAYVVNHRGKFLLDESAPLKDVNVGEDSVLILVKKSNCPAADVNKGEEDE